MSLDGFVSYLNTNLASPSDREKCLNYLESLGLNQDNTEFAHEILERWTRVGLFNGTLSLAYMCQATTTGVRKHQPCASDEPSAKRFAHIKFS
jgi:hypothetical protein